MDLDLSAFADPNDQQDAARVVARSRALLGADPQAVVAALVGGWGGEGVDLQYLMHCDRDDFVGRMTRLLGD